MEESCFELGSRQSPRLVRLMARHVNIGSIAFPSDSRLLRIKDSTFLFELLPSIYISRSIGVISWLYFAGRSVEGINIQEQGVKETRFAQLHLRLDPIEESAFQD
jgi:hypothetical protein